MAESLQRIIVRRALFGQHFQAAQQVIDSLEGTVERWNLTPSTVSRKERRSPEASKELRGSAGLLEALL